MEALASLFEEGTPSIVPKIINGALLGMLATLLALYFYFPDLAKMHIYVLGFLVAGLMISVNWLLIEMRKLPVAKQGRDSPAIPSKTD